MNQISSENILSLLGAIPAAALGGASFLRGVLGVAAALRLLRLLVATTLAAFATSSPELAVSSLATLSGKPGIGLGDALGSNLFNGLAVVGVAATLHPIHAPSGEIGVAVAFVVITLLLVMPRQDAIPRRHGLALLCAYGLFVFATAIAAF